MKYHNLAIFYIVWQKHEQILTLYYEVSLDLFHYKIEDNSQKQHVKLLFKNQILVHYNTKNQSDLKAKLQNEHFVYANVLVR